MMPQAAPTRNVMATPPGQPRERAHLLALLAVLLAAIAVYLPSLANGFAYDDVTVIQLDERVHDLSGALRFLAESYWRDTDLGLYRPLASISYAVDWRASGGAPAWFHFVNALWNAGVCGLLFLFLRGLVPLPAALVGALLFAVHPVHVESVANIVGRAELMAAFFVLAAMLLWLRVGDRRVPLPRGLAVAALYACALMSKESAIMLPALLVLTDAAAGVLTPASVREWLRLRIVPMSLLFVTALLFLAVRTVVLGDVAPPRVDPLLDVADSAGSRVLTALQMWPVIAKLMVAPFILLSDYGPPTFLPALGWTSGAVMGAVLLGSLVAGGAAAWLRGHGRLAFALLFLPVAYLPVSNLVLPIGVVLAERTLYLPSLAVAAAAAFLFNHMGRSPRHFRAAAAAAAVVLVLFAVRVQLRIPDWESTDTVFAALRRDDPASSRGLLYSARVAVSQERPHDALAYYARTLQAWPWRRHQVVEAASYAAYVGDVEFAARVGTHALRRWPDDVSMIRVMAGLALDRSDTTEARLLIARGLQLAPADSLLLRMNAAAGGN
jgi:protein O-mannosyl-transferase